MMTHLKTSGYLQVGIVLIIVAFLYFIFAFVLKNMATISLIVGMVLLVLGFAFLGLHFIERIRKRQKRE